MSKSTSKNIELKIFELRAELHDHNHRYYNLASPIVSDKEFDVMLKELEKLEVEHPEFEDQLSPTNRPGGNPVDGFEKVEHSTPMLSLSNTYDQDEVELWMARVVKGLEGEDVVNGG